MFLKQAYQIGLQLALSECGNESKSSNDKTAEIKKRAEGMYQSPGRAAEMAATFAGDLAMPVVGGAIVGGIPAGMSHNDTWGRGATRALSTSLGGLLGAGALGSAGYNIADALDASRKAKILAALGGGLTGLVGGSIGGRMLGEHLTDYVPPK